MSQSGLIGIPAGSLPPSVPTTFTGNTGGPVSPVANNMNILTSSSTLKFVGTAATQTINFGISNLLLGGLGLSITSAARNVGVGQNILGVLSSGMDNVAMGAGGTGSALSSGSNNTLLGGLAGQYVTTGSGNTLIGKSSGSAYTTSESNNITINNAGVIGESAVTRIGTQGTMTAAYLAGVTGVTTSSSNMVTINSSTGQLGAAAMPGYSLTLTQVAVFPTPLDSTTYYMTTAATWSTTIAGATTGRLWIPKTGTITAAYGSVAVTGTLGTAENTSVEIRLNNTTNTNITSTLQCTAALNTFNNAALSIAVTAGDYIHFQVITPAWATNPTSVVFNCSIMVS